MHRSRIRLVVSCMMLIINVPILWARPQAGGGTTAAKQHYQNAVAAIAKNDWVSAKAELLQAEKLAPQNALIHYDLALAYGHTGSPKSAQAELNKALQLGLPAEQKRAAEQLKNQLSNSNASTQEKALKPEHSVEDIVSWIVSNANFSKSGSAGGVTSTVERGQTDSCSLKVFNQTFIEKSDGNGQFVDWGRTVMFAPAGILDPKKISVRSLANSPDLLFGGPYNEISQKLSINLFRLKIQTRNPNRKSKDSSG